MPRSPMTFPETSHSASGTLRLTSVLRTSFLSDVDPRIVHALIRRAIVHDIAEGEIFVSETDAQWTGIVLSGVARVFLRTPAGRQVTLRNAMAGGSIGIAALLGSGSVSAQAITDCQVLRFDNQQVVSLADSQPRLAMAIARELSVCLLDTYAEIVIRDEGSVHQRLARQLLNSSVRDPQSPLAVRMSHSEIADAVGSVREVVTRHLDRFQTAGMLRLERGRITILDPHRLHEAATDAD
jgi:CRP-like cAMP-binding protein